MTLALKILCATVWLSALLAHPMATAAPQRVSTITVMPWDFEREPQLEKRLTQAGFNHATLYIPWADVEPEPGQFRYGKFDALIERLTSQGLSVILLLDFGGREHFDDQGQKTGHSVLPAWAASLDKPEALMRDFTGGIAPQLSLLSPALKAPIDRFITHATQHFGQRHGRHILGFAIGLQEEHEIKFGQIGYRWRDYSEATQKLFQQTYGAPMPVLNYNREIGQPHPRIEPLLTPLRLFREKQLRDSTCHYAHLIRQQNHLAIAYFGETLTSHDAIYATGIVEELADCIDIAIIDFNFYDGYQLQASPHTLPLLTSYLASSGYRRIMAGAYGERWVEAGRVAELLPHIETSLAQALRQSAVIGFEIGGMQRQLSPTQSGSIDFDLLDRLRIASPPAAPASPPRFHIGLLASKSNFYFWHGERSHGRNIHQDALTQAWALLSAQPNVRVSVIGEKTLRDNPALTASLHAIVVPHQAALPAVVKEQLMAYWQAGGILVQDLRLGEFRDDGTPTYDWLHQVFGIQSIQWSQAPARFAYQGKTLTFSLAGKAYANHAVLQAQPGYTLRAKLLPSRSSWRYWWHKLLFWRQPRLQDVTHGLMVRGERSLAFGFLPQLAEGPDADAWHRAFTAEILDLLQHQAKRPPSPSPPALSASKAL